MACAASKRASSRRSVDPLPRQIPLIRTHFGGDVARSVCAVRGRRNSNSALTTERPAGRCVRTMWSPCDRFGRAPRQDPALRTMRTHFWGRSALASTPFEPSEIAVCTGGRSGHVRATGSPPRNSNSAFEEAPAGARWRQTVCVDGATTTAGASTQSCAGIGLCRRGHHNGGCVDTESAIDRGRRRFIALLLFVETTIHHAGPPVRSVWGLRTCTSPRLVCA